MTDKPITEVGVLRELLALAEQATSGQRYYKSHDEAIERFRQFLAHTDSPAVHGIMAAACAPAVVAALVRAVLLSTDEEAQP